MSIETETCLLPGIIADGVCQEAAVALDSDIPLEYSDRLAEHAEVCYKAGARWSSLIRSTRGTTGRDTLYAFMRHWLAGYLNKEHHDLFVRLPSGFAVGRV
jgi:hypothetical protein